MKLQKLNPVFIIALLAAFIALPAFGEPLQVQIKIAKQKFVVGEPILMETTWLNTSAQDLALINFPPINGDDLRIIGSVRKECAEPIVDVKKTGPHILKAGDKLIDVRSLQDWGVVGAGNYDVSVEYNSSQLNPKAIPEDAAKLRAGSNHVKFKIVRPTGIDAAAFSDFGTACGRLSHGYVQKYPTSVYSAWAYLDQFQWWKSTQEASSFLVMLQKPDYPGSNVLRGPDGEPISDGKGGYKFQSGKEWMQTLITQGAPILSAHGDDPYLGPRLRIDLALANIAIGRHETARALLDELSKKAPTSDLAPRAKEYLGAMKKAGLVP